MKHTKNQIRKRARELGLIEHYSGKEKRFFFTKFCSPVKNIHERINQKATQ